MELKTYDDVLALHSNFADTFRKRIEEMKKTLPKSTDALIKSKSAEIKAAIEAAKAAEKARDTLVKRANAEIAQHKEVAARLTLEVEEIQKGSKTKPDPKLKAPARPAKPK